MQLEPYHNPEIPDSVPDAVPDGYRVEYRGLYINIIKDGINFGNLLCASSSSIVLTIYQNGSTYEKLIPFRDLESAKQLRIASSSLSEIPTFVTLYVQQH